MSRKNFVLGWVEYEKKYYYLGARSRVFWNSGHAQNNEDRLWQGHLHITYKGPANDIADDF